MKKKEKELEKYNCCCDDECECGCQDGEECTCDCCDDECDCGCQDGEECTCDCCDDECECGCQDGEECTCDCCDDECDCHEENCGCCDDSCDHDEECHCGDECHRHDKDIIIKQLEDSLLRSKAEFLNYRKRLEDEQSRLLKYCNEDLIKELLPILDNFERAISMDNENLEDEVSKFLSGFKMIYCNLVNILKANGVVEIDGNNKPFDPVYHEAIMTEKKDDVEKEMVLEVLQKGYILKGKVIRPAMVKVSE